MLLVNVCPVKDPTRLTVISLISGAWLYRCKLTHFCTLRKEEIHFVAFIVMPAVILQSAYSNRRSQHYLLHIVEYGGQRCRNVLLMKRMTAADWLFQRVAAFKRWCDLCRDTQTHSVLCCTYAHARDLSADNAAWQRDFLFPALITSAFSLAGSVWARPSLSCRRLNAQLLVERFLGRQCRPQYLSVLTPYLLTHSLLSFALVVLAATENNREASTAFFIHFNRFQNSQYHWEHL